MRSTLYFDRTSTARYVYAELSYNSDGKLAIFWVTDLSDFRGVAFPRVVHFLMDSSSASAYPAVGSAVDLCNATLYCTAQILIVPHTQPRLSAECGARLMSLKVASSLGF